MIKTTLVLGLAALLSACASGPEKVLAAEPDSVRIGWYRAQLSEGVVRGLALRYCNGRPIEEVVDENYVGPFYRAKTWKCLGA